MLKPIWLSAAMWLTLNAAGTVAAQGSAQAPAAAPAAMRAASRAATAKLPDWSGAWALDDASFAATRASSGSTAPNDPNVPKMTPQAAAYRLANGAANGGQGPPGGVPNNAAKCMPDGMPGIMTAPLQFEFLFTPGRVTIIASNSEVRRIYTDGRPHPADPDFSFEGNSIGHWEGDTLVVDTVAILPKSEMFMGFPGPVNTERTHVVERMFRQSASKFVIDTVITNPDVLAEPFRYRRSYDYVKDMEEALCAENNRDFNGVIDLTPPTPK